MLDAFAEVLIKKASDRESEDRLVREMMKLPMGDLQKLASSGQLTASKEASDDDWLERYEGTPLYSRAIALEEELLRIEGERIQRRLDRPADDDLWTKEDMIRLKKRQLDLELSKGRSDGEDEDEDDDDLSRYLADDDNEGAEDSDEGKTAGIGSALMSGAKGVGSAIGGGAKATGAAIQNGAKLKTVGSVLGQSAQGVGSALGSGVKGVGATMSPGAKMLAAGVGGAALGAGAMAMTRPKQEQPKIAGIGGVLDAATGMFSGAKKAGPGNRVQGAVRGGAGSFLGGAGGAALGAGVGSLLGPVGTFAGGLIGGSIGSSKGFNLATKGLGPKVGSYMPTLEAVDMAGRALAHARYRDEG
jgi:hypothetical protein